MEAEVDSAGNQGSDRPDTPDRPDVHIVSMARVMLGKSADSYGGCDNNSFVQGYEKGFEAGWSLGYRQALQDGRKQGCAEVEAELKKGVDDSRESTHGGEERRDRMSDQMARDIPSQSSGAICLLSDVVLEEPWRPSTNGNICLLSDVAISPIRDEDVFYDAASSFSADSEDLLDIFYDAEQHVVVSDSSSAASAGDEPSIAVTEPSSLSRSVTPHEPEEEDLLDLSYDADQQTHLSKSTDSDKTVASSPTAQSPATTTALAPLTTPSPLNPVNTTHTTTTLATDTDTSWIPRPLNKPWLPTPNPNTKTLFNVPLPHSLQTQPINPVPKWSIPLPTRRPRPAYPALSGANIYTLAREGRTIVEDPWRVLIGPLSEAARDAWRGDSGKAYLRGKLGVCSPYGQYRGGGYRGGGGGGGGGRGNWGYGGGNEGGHGEDAGGGVAFCQMVSDGDGVGYLLVMFESQEKAREAERLFWGYPCGGSFMWAWFYREAE